MRYRLFPKINRSVSVIGMGCWGIGGQYGPVTEETAIRTVRHAVDIGINLFDTADAYGIEPGYSEELVGKALYGVREKVYIATKVGNWGRRMGHPFPYTSPLHVYACCDASLHRLRTDYIDLYQCHISHLEDPSIFLEAFDHLVEKGKIRAYGISTDNLEVLHRFNRTGQCTVCQLDYSLLNRAPEKEFLPYCREHQIGTLIRGPLAQGLLTGKFTRESHFTDSVRQGWNDGDGRLRFLQRLDRVEKLHFLRKGRSLAQAALQFVLAHPAVICAIPGAKSPEQIDEQAGAADSHLDEEELKQINVVLNV